MALPLETILDILDALKAQEERRRQIEAAKAEMRTQKADVLAQKAEADTAAVDLNEYLKSLMRDRSCRASTECKAHIREVQQSLKDAKSGGLQALSASHFIQRKIDTLAGDLSIVLDGDEAYLRYRA